MRVLCLAPHCDDEVLGCGGTLARYVREGHDVHVAVVTGNGEGEHPLIARTDFDLVRTEARQAMNILGVSHLHFGNVPAVQVDDIPRYELNRAVYGLIELCAPEVLLVPHPFDMHKDHREIFHAASVAWRPVSNVGRAIREVYAYEVLSETHWNASTVEPGFSPNVFVDISGLLEVKLSALACYKSQIQPFPNIRSLKSIESLAYLRGSQVGVEAAEAYVMIRRVV